VDDSGKAISFSDWATLAQDRAGWLKLVTKVPFDIGNLRIFFTSQLNILSESCDK